MTRTSSYLTGLLGRARLENFRIFHPALTGLAFLCELHALELDGTVARDDQLGLQEPQPTIDENSHSKLNYSGVPSICPSCLARLADPARLAYKW